MLRSIYSLLFFSSGNCSIGCIKLVIFFLKETKCMLHGKPVIIHRAMEYTEFNDACLTVPSPNGKSVLTILISFDVLLLIGPLSFSFETILRRQRPNRLQILNGSTVKRTCQLMLYRYAHRINKCNSTCKFYN